MMEYRIPKKGEIYRHFKGNLYEVVIIARDSENLEEKVVYKEVDGDAAYVRSLPMFVSRVDKEKYPDARQEFRFELVQENVNENKAHDSDQVELCHASHSMIMEYLDIDTVDDKIQYLLRMKENITEAFIEVVAQSMDFTEKEGSLMERYEALLRYLRTVAKYESGRLR